MAPNLLNEGAGSGGGVSAGHGAQHFGVYVVQWVDYSSKYGLGYLLSNGCSGVFFNDSTKIVLDPTGASFEFLQRRSQDKVDIVQTHSIAQYPPDLKKKVTLLKHFRNYLVGEKLSKEIELPHTDVERPMVFVKKWMKTHHAILFRLSNKVV
jgi:polo-like kinase 1